MIYHNKKCFNHQLRFFLFREEKQKGCGDLWEKEYFRIILTMEDKDKIIKALKDFGRLPTTRVAGITGLFQPKAKTLLDELVTEKKVNKIEETNATYWEIK